jgi:Ca2+-binding EF-hand superfamily protein
MKSILLTLLLTPALVFAADDEAKPKKPAKGTGKPAQNPAAAYKKMDTSGDGIVTLEEFKASPRGQKNPDRAEKAFAKLDKDSDSKLTLEEFKSASTKKPEKPKKADSGDEAPEKKKEKKPDAPAAEEPKKSV